VLHIWYCSLRVNDLTLILLTWRKWRAPNASKKQMGFNSGLKGLINMGNFNTNFILLLCAFVGVLINNYESRVDSFHIFRSPNLMTQLPTRGSSWHSRRWKRQDYFHCLSPSSAASNSREETCSPRLAALAALRTCQQRCRYSSARYLNQCISSSAAKNGSWNRSLPVHLRTHIAFLQSTGMPLNSTCFLGNLIMIFQLTRSRSLRCVCQMTVNCGYRYKRTVDPQDILW
jgi:hypothetical protein